MTALMETASSKVTSAQGLRDRSQSSRAHLPHFEPHTPTAPSANPTTDDAPASTPIEPIASYTSNFLSKGRVIGHTRMSNDCDLGPSANSTHIRTRRHAPRTSRESCASSRNTYRYYQSGAEQQELGRRVSEATGNQRDPTALARPVIQSPVLHLPIRSSNQPFAHHGFDVFPRVHELAGLVPP